MRVPRDCVPLAIGVGCKANCPAEAISALVRRALTLARFEGPATLYTIEGKRSEPGLALAAAQLDLPLVFLPLRALQAISARTQTRSPRVLALFGVPSVAETAALAGAGLASKLIVPRIESGGATCAVARPGGDGTADRFVAG